MNFKLICASAMTLAAITAPQAMAQENAGTDGESGMFEVYVGNLEGATAGGETTDASAATVMLSLEEAAEACGVDIAFIEAWQHSTAYCVATMATDAVNSAMGELGSMDTMNADDAQSDGDAMQDETADATGDEATLSSTGGVDAAGNDVEPAGADNSESDMNAEDDMDADGGMSDDGSSESDMNGQDDQANQ